MEYIEYNGRKIAYQVETSNRKTVSIRIGREGVIVRAPRALSKRRIAELVQTKAHWIIEKYDELKSQEPDTAKIGYEDGCPVLYRGHQLTLKLVDGRAMGLSASQGEVWVENNQIKMALCEPSKGAIEHLLEQWFRYEARNRIEERVRYYTSHYDFGKRVNRITIKDQKSRWGSCSTRCNLNFNYRLIKAPDEVLDYVVVHELCHLLHMNHSSAFWNAVSTILPEYNQCKEWLRKNGARLS